jgi:hypothetical protein
MRVGPWKVSSRSRANPTTSSGASSAVNASLKVKVAKKRAGAKEVARIYGMPDRLCSVWKVTTTYAKVTSTHRSSGLGLRNVLTVSGSPANFWPVWFQLRVSLRAAKDNTWLAMEERREVLK